MITSFKKFNLKENADLIKGYNFKYDWDDGDARPFFFKVNEDHTKVKNLYIGDYDETHGDIPESEDDDIVYPGRLWTHRKIMAFWVYPNEVLFTSMIKSLEKKLGIKIFNNDWRIEVIKNDNEIERTKFNNDTFNYYGDNHYKEIKTDVIPLDDYVGSENPSEEEHIMHMMNWKEKALAKKAGKLNINGWGSDKTAWDSPHNIEFRQKIYQEKKNN